MLISTAHHAATVLRLLLPKLAYLLRCSLGCAPANPPRTPMQKISLRAWISLTESFALFQKTIYCNLYYSKLNDVILMILSAFFPSHLWCQTSLSGSSAFLLVGWFCAS
jgi:hypothetical protein